MVGLDTWPRRMTGLPATGRSVGFVVSASSPMSPLSPGAEPFQSSMTLVGSEAKSLTGVSAKAEAKTKVANWDGFTRETKPNHCVQSRDFGLRAIWLRLTASSAGASYHLM